ncbi:hypothetical protein C0Q70_17671 [Pomacea canaliculata]|uniref:WAP domain-containing protein n=1 Tax=Pomacea canaliculata TaxID=400727 RepID=A0A2T7NL32_POMCA|nr:hypothetical protein C0Q70_17671 [Pomacea canaliculata]
MLCALGMRIKCALSQWSSLPTEARNKHKQTRGCVGIPGVAVTASTNQTFIPGSVEEEFGENERARSCPDPSQLPRSCVQQCRLHVDCQPNMACCSNGCGRICAAVSHRE